MNFAMISILCFRGADQFAHRPAFARTMRGKEKLLGGATDAFRQGFAVDGVGELACKDSKEEKL
jgi:hypothetical protein